MRLIREAVANDLIGGRPKIFIDETLEGLDEHFTWAAEDLDNRFLVIFSAPTRIEDDELELELGYKPGLGLHSRSVP